ncbi:hypothetical protein ACE6H2_022493 [Prunus campanulata]
MAVRQESGGEAVTGTQEELAIIPNQTGYSEGQVRRELLSQAAKLDIEKGKPGPTIPKQNGISKRASQDLLSQNKLGYQKG